MDLLDYLIALDGGNNQSPDNLVLPKSFVEELSKLYTVSEDKGLEHGLALFCDRASGTFSYGKPEPGLSTSMNIPVSTHPNNFGNIHAHPSASIGHVGGYSAHSMQDLAKFESTQNRPYFIQFVVSGPRFYAMVQVQGVSDWDNTVRPFLGQRQGDEEGEMRSAMVAAAGGPSAYEAYFAALGNDPDPVAYGKKQDALKRKANLGKLMQTLSMRHCAEFAKKFHYFFYAGEGILLTPAS